MSHQNPRPDAKHPAATVARPAAAQVLKPVGYLMVRRYGARLLHPLEAKGLN